MKATLWFSALAVLVFVAAVAVFPRLAGTGDDEISLTKKETAALVLSLRAHRDTFGVYPGGNSSEAIAALRGQNPKDLVFLEIAPERISSSGEYVDVWGSPYRFGGEMTARMPWAYSVGPDKMDEGGKGDDVASWH